MNKYGVIFLRHIRKRFLAKAQRRKGRTVDVFCCILVIASEPQLDAFISPITSLKFLMVFFVKLIFAFIFKVVKSYFIFWYFLVVFGGAYTKFDNRCFCLPIIG